MNIISPKNMLRNDISLSVLLEGKHHMNLPHKITSVLPPKKNIKSFIYFYFKSRYSSCLYLAEMNLSLVQKKGITL